MSLLSALENLIDIKKKIETFRCSLQTRDDNSGKDLTSDIGYLICLSIDLELTYFPKNHTKTFKYVKVCRCVVTKVNNIQMYKQ